MNNLHIQSEIAPLKKVLLHCPGKELLNITPQDAGELLFDDIPYLKEAQSEHNAFAALLRANNVEVVYLKELMAQLLDDHPSLKPGFIKQWLQEGNIHTTYWQNRLTEYLNQLPNNLALVEKSMEGITLKEVGGPQAGSLEDLTADPDELVVAPMPNLYFTRDPAFVVGSCVGVNTMHYATRKRETIYLDYIQHYHPAFSGSHRCYDRNEGYSLEGGDVLVLSDQVIAVGLSQRTEPDAIEHLAVSLFNDKSNRVSTILAFQLPKERAFMHLDTVLTQVDYDKFTIHARALHEMRCFEITPDKNGVHISELHDSLAAILEHYLKLTAVDLIVCGGDDGIAAQREQWNDGSNTLCLAPGKIVTYRRNEVTNAILRQKGIEVLEIDSGELSRGRGGPHCMSMPLIRE
jgi:arginine deiminase